MIEGLLLLVLSTAFVRRSRRLRSPAALLAALALLVPASGLLLASAGVQPHPAARIVALITQAMITLGVLLEDVSEARVQARIAQVDRVVERRRVVSASARARAYTALRTVEDHLGVR